MIISKLFSCEKAKLTKRLFLFLILALAFNRAFSQAPNISYQTPQVYTINTTISPLTVNNTGGVVPTAIYGNVSTFAGSGLYNFTNGVGAAASFRDPVFLTFDAQGNLYVADAENNVIRKIAPDATVTTFAGSGSPGKSNGTATTATFNYPVGVVTDAQGNIFVADQNNNLIRKITPAGVVSTFAGNGTIGKINGTGTSASFNSPFGMAFDSKGNLYVADGGNNLIRKITPAGVVSTFAGSGSQGNTNGTGAAASFNSPTDVTADSQDNIFVADHNNDLIRKITPAGVVTTFAGGGPDDSDNATTATVNFGNPYCMRVDKQGNMYVAAEFYDQIKIISPDGSVRNLAGTGNCGYANGIGTSAAFCIPVALALDTHNNLFVSDNSNIRIRQIALTGYTIDKPLPTGLVFNYTNGTISGTPTVTSPATNYTITAYNAAGSSSSIVTITVNAAVLGIPPDVSYQTPQVYPVNKAIAPLQPTNIGGTVPAANYGTVTSFAGSAAGLNIPAGIASDQQGNFYIANEDDNSILKISPTGVVTTLATAVQFDAPSGVAVDALGNVYVADSQNNLIRKITPAGLVTTIAGTGAVGTANGPGASATFNQPAAIALDLIGNIFVADAGNNLIRKIDVNGNVSTFAGNGSAAYADGTGASASFWLPEGLCTDLQGDVFVADFGNNRIREITPAGVVTTYAGAGAQGDLDGAPASATFNQPYGVAIDIYNNIYVVEESGNRIRKVAYAGLVSTLAGTGTAGANNGPDPTASFFFPRALTVDPNGNIYIADSQNNQIREIALTGYTIDKTLPAGLSFDQATGIISGTPTVASPATNYTITAYNYYGKSSLMISIAVTNGPIKFATIPSKTVCDVDFDPGAVSPNGPVTYSSGNVGVATIVSNQVHIVGPGTATIAATDGVTTLTQVLTVSTPVMPAIAITPVGLTSCNGIAITFTASVINAGVNPTYQWTLNGQPAGTNSPTYTGFFSGKDQINCTLTNNSDCTAGPVTSNTATVMAQAYLTPSVSIVASPAGEINCGTEVTFTATPVNGGANPSYQWQVNNADVGGNSQVFSSSCLNNGDVVTCVLTNQGGACLTALTAISNNITADVSGVLSVKITASANPVYAGTAVTFTATTTGEVATYQWLVNGKDAGNNGDEFTSSTLQNNDTVECSIVANGNCSTAVSNLLTMNILQPVVIIIPNTFTPNGDGINDQWNISALASYPNCTVDIFTRYGTSVYHSKGYSHAWDGTYKGDKLPVGTYYYVINLGDNSAKLSGFISLIR